MNTHKIEFENTINKECSYQYLQKNSFLLREETFLDTNFSKIIENISETYLLCEIPEYLMDKYWDTYYNMKNYIYIFDTYIFSNNFVDKHFNDILNNNYVLSSLLKHSSVNAFRAVMKNWKYIPNNIRSVLIITGAIKYYPHDWVEKHINDFNWEYIINYNTSLAEPYLNILSYKIKQYWVIRKVHHE